MKLKMLSCGLASSILAVAFATPTTAIAEGLGTCEIYSSSTMATIHPATAGHLTVEVNLPAPGWWNGDTPEQIHNGYEYCLAANIAHRLGLSSVDTVNVAFEALVAGQTRHFDLALSEVTITDERRKVVDFSPAYFSSDIGILTRKGKEVTAEQVKDLRIGVTQGTTGADFVDAKIKPKIATRVFPDTPAMVTALQAGQIDVAMTDTAIVLGLASESGGRFDVVGQYTTGESYGALYPKESKNSGALDAVIQSLIDDGSTKKLAATYLAAAWGTDPTKIPYFKP